MTYQQWMDKVDMWTERTCGATTADLPDWNSWDAWDQGDTPAQYGADLLEWCGMV